MGVAANSLDVMRKFFRKSGYHQAPFIPQAGYSQYSGLGAYSGSFGFDYLNSNTSIFGLQDYIRIEQDLITRYVDYEDQDDSPLISSALDIYSDDASQTDTLSNHSIWVEAEDEDIRRDLMSLFHHRLKVEETVWAKIRTLCKYGNDFAELVVRDGDGVVAMNMLPPPTMRRIEVPADISKFVNRENDTPETLGFIYDPKGVFKLSTRQFIEQLNQRAAGTFDPTKDPISCGVMENWEVVHGRLLGKNPTTVYGHGIGEPARWIYKRLVLLEDSVVLHRLTRAPSRYAFYVDVSNIPPQETQSYLNKVRQSLKRQKFVNSATGKLDMRYAVASGDEDFFMPVRDGKESTRVETIQGPIYDAIEDIKYFEAKLFAALKVPKPFLTYEESTAKTHLSAEDARFARTILRIQREVKNMYKKTCQVHLAARGINPGSVDFSVEMTMPSAIFELAQLEIRAAELDLADKFGAYAPKSWIMNHILGFSDEQILEMDEMRKREEEGGDAPASGSAAGSLDKALSKRGQRAPAPPTESRMSSDEYWNKGSKVNTGVLLEKIDNLRRKNEEFDRRWSRIQTFMGDLKDNLRAK